MAGNAWGADWACYHKEKQLKKDKAIARKNRTPCIYLLYKCHKSLTFFGNPQLIIKVGKSERNALTRYSEQKWKGFYLEQSWNIDKSILSKCELEVIHELKDKFGAPIEGRETFLACEIEIVKNIISNVIEKYA